MDSKKIELSIVVPLLDEEENILPLYEQIKDTLQDKHSYEIIFIDDGSQDQSLNVLKELQSNNNQIRVISFRRNFGQTAALSAGFDYAKGEIIIAMDADLQNDPADIPKLLEKLDQGYDIVSGWRKDRKDKAVTRKLPSMIANYLIRKITSVDIHDTGCTLKAYRKDLLDETKLYGEMHRFIPAIASWSGAKVSEIVVNHRPRIAGKAKYGLTRTFKVILDLMTIKFLATYSTKPLYIFGGFGAWLGLGSVLSGATVLYQKFISCTQPSMNRNPLLLLTAILIITSIQFVLMGLLAEIMVRTYHESQNRPTYAIRDIFETNKDETKNKA